MCVFESFLKIKDPVSQNRCMSLYTDITIAHIAKKDVHLINLVLAR